MLPTGWRIVGASSLGSVRALHNGGGSMYIGAKLPLLSSAPSTTEADQQQQQQQQSAACQSTEQGNSKKDILDGMPMKWLADYLGERMWPVLGQVKEDAIRRRSSMTKQNVAVFEPPSIPHVLPLTKWAAESEALKETLVVDESNRQRARLSWYHPDDTMVPRDWFKGGLWEDLKYYKPFMSSRK